MIIMFIKYGKLESLPPTQTITIVAASKNTPVTVEMRPLFIWIGK